MMIEQTQLFFALLVVWFLMSAFLGYVSYYRQVQTARMRLLQRRVWGDDDEGGGDRPIGMGTRLVTKPTHVDTAHPRSSSSLFSPLPPLCHWRPTACVYLNRTRNAIADWRSSRSSRSRRSLRLRQQPAICNQPFAPIRLSLRGQHFRSWWGHIMPTIVESAENNCSIGCRIQGIRPTDAHVVVDTFSPGASRLSFIEYPRKIAVVALEAGGSGPHTSEALEATDLLVSWMQDEAVDVPINYMYSWQDLCRHIRPEPLDIEACMAPVPTREQLAEKRLAAAFVSNCGGAALERKLFMRALFQHLSEARRPVDSWGKCMRTPGLPRNERDAIPRNRSILSKARPADKSGADARRGFQKIALLETRYKFAFAFENAIRPDYVTEKALQPLLASVIPVVWGSPNACALLPGVGASRLCINAMDFHTPRALADHLLRLDRDDELYLQHFAWRRDQGGPGLKDDASSVWNQMQTQSFTSLGDHSWPCRLCKVYRKRYCEA